MKSYPAVLLKAFSFLRLLIGGGFSFGSNVETLHRRKEKIHFCEERRKSSLAKKRRFSGHFVRGVCEPAREVQVGMMGCKGPVRGRNCWHSMSGKLVSFFLLSNLKFKVYLSKFQNVFSGPWEKLLAFHEQKTCSHFFFSFPI